MFSMFRHHAPQHSAEDATATPDDRNRVAPNQTTPDAPNEGGAPPTEADENQFVEPGALNHDLPDGSSSGSMEDDLQVTDGDHGKSPEDVTATAAEESEAQADESAATDDDAWDGALDGNAFVRGANLRGLAKGPQSRGSSRAMKKKPATVPRQPFTGAQRLLLLDTWIRSGLPAGDFAPLIGISKHTLYKWKEQFQDLGPAGLMDQPRRVRRGSQLPELTKRTILMLKEAHPEWGCQRISDMLCRGPALPASASAVARVLHEAGYEAVDVPTKSHPDKVRRFERARPNQLWQTDLFTFVLKRQNRRVHMVAFLDDHSRFIVSFGLHATGSTALVVEALEAGIASYGPAEEVLTDNGPQYVTWRGKSQFTRHLEKRGIKQIVARPRRPQTLGKVERFWGTLWREFLEAAIFVDLADARARIGHFIDYYNFQRVHRGIEGLVPADRFFGAAQEILKTLKERVAANALELARHGEPRPPFYVTGQVDGESFSVHAEGERLILRKENEPRQEITLTGDGGHVANVPPPLPTPVCPHAAPPSAPGEPAESPPAAPGTSALDAPEPESSDEEGGAP